MGSCALKGGGCNKGGHTNALVLYAPKMENGVYKLKSEFEMSSGDVVEIEAYLTPETMARAQAYGEGMKARLAPWLDRKVKLRGDWSQFGLMGRAAATVAKKTAEHPLLNLPVIGSEDDKSHPAYEHSKEVLGDYQMFQRLRSSAARPGCRQDWRELMAGCCHYGNCCCGKKRIAATYDGGWLLGSSVSPHDLIAHHVTDVQALRSYRAIYG